ncbi:hypothetical protein [Streptomyces parvus]|nr:hypothetical protein [Streptomyces parvus]
MARERTEHRGETHDAHHQTLTEMAWHTVKRFSDAAEPEDLFTGQ